ncbi:MAG: hypothetical protein ACKVP8_07680, partial [Nitrospiraceae bacterium]
MFIVKVSIWLGTSLKSVRRRRPASVAVAPHPASLEEEIANGESAPVGSPVPEIRFAVARRHDLGEGCQRERTRHAHTRAHTRAHTPAHTPRAHGSAHA